MKEPDTPHNPRRKYIRVPTYDYSAVGAYFMTICVEDRRCILGEVSGESVILSRIGRVIEEEWKNQPTHFPHVRCDEFVIMPNHLHGIIWIEETEGTINRPLREIIRAFKARSTITIRRTLDRSFTWQRNYYEHIIRDDEDLFNHRKYILENPLKWELDKEYVKEI